MLKVGIVRCAIVAEFCPASSCIKAIKEREGAFKGLDVELIGLITCGGCPGKKVSSNVKTLIEKGADIIALSSCMTRGYPVGSNAFVCQNLEDIKKSIEEFLKKNAPNVRIIDWTH